MTNPASHDDPRAQFATGLQQRLEALIGWANEHWPEQSQPLRPDDFSATRREIALLLGARLHVDTPADVAPAPADGGEQYVNVTPAPWP